MFGLIFLRLGGAAIPKFMLGFALFKLLGFWDGVWLNDRFSPRRHLVEEGDIEVAVHSECEGADLIPCRKQFFSLFKAKIDKAASVWNYWAVKSVYFIGF